MFGSIAVGTRSIEEYQPVVGRTAIDELRTLAEPLQGVRVLHLSSPTASNSVRNLLSSTMPLMADLGLRAQWQQLRIPSEFTAMDRQFRSALSGARVGWTARDSVDWTAFNLLNAELFDEEFDVVVVHHTASVGLYEAVSQVRGTRPPGAWIWHSHRDYRAALPGAWRVVQQHAADFGAAVFDAKGLIHSDTPNRIVAVVPLGVDALGARGLPVASEIRDALFSQRNIDVHRPILAQVVSSIRPEPPLAVLETFEMVKAYRPEVQLVTVNLAFAEGSELRQTTDIVASRAEKIGGALLLTELGKVGNVENSALRQEAAVMVHQGRPSGVSLALLEEMWQGKPIVSARSLMAAATLDDGTGILADSPMDQAEAIIRLLDSPGYAARLGRNAHRAVARRFLLPHHLKAYLKLFARLLRRPASRKR